MNEASVHYRLCSSHVTTISPSSGAILQEGKWLRLSSLFITHKCVVFLTTALRGLVSAESNLMFVLSSITAFKEFARGEAQFPQYEGK